ncbi:MAG: DUF4352 domain-containing protein [Patescibacteria group bacterium]
MPQDTPVKKNWYAEHKVMTGAFVLSSLFILSCIAAAVSEYDTGSKVASVMTDSSPTSDDSKDSDVVTAHVGDAIDFSSFSMKVLSSREATTISSRYGSAQTAKEGTKFVIFELQVTALTNTEFTFFPDQVLKLVDSQSRQFNTYDNTIGSIDNYLDVRTLSPSIPEKGVIVYEIPDTESAYALAGVNSVTGTVYMVAFPELKDQE